MKKQRVHQFRNRDPTLIVRPNQQVHKKLNLRIDGDGFGYGLHIMSHSWGGGSLAPTMERAVYFCFRNQVIFVASRGTMETAAPITPPRITTTGWSAWEQAGRMDSTRVLQTATLFQVRECLGGNQVLEEVWT